MGFTIAVFVLDVIVSILIVCTDWPSIAAKATTEEKTLSIDDKESSKNIEDEFSRI